MDRRKFIKRGTVATAATALSFGVLKEAHSASTNNKAVAQKSGELVAVMGNAPADMLRRAIEELGGIDKFVKSGDKVVVKPNIGWAKTPEMSSNTNPEVVGALVKLCMDAGAEEVLVFDHTCNEWTSCYDLSGIEAATKEGGGKMIPGNSENYYKEVTLSKGKILKTTKIHEAILNCDVWFNVPVLKQHGGAKMSLSMKNYMGIIWDRQCFHKDGLQQCIADVCTYEKKPALNIIDGFRSLTQNGPQGKSVDDVADSKVLFASSDPIAVDTAAIKFFSQIKELDPNDVSHVANGEAHQLGTTDLSSINIKRVKL